jgi:hypothetical protein
MAPAQGIRESSTPEADGWATLLCGWQIMGGVGQVCGLDPLRRKWVSKFI